MSTATDLPAQAPGEEIFPASRNRNEFSENLGTEMTLEQIAEKLKTQEGKMEVLQMIKDVNPELNGNVEKAGDIIPKVVQVLDKMRTGEEKKIQTGFFDYKTHEILDSDECMATGSLKKRYMKPIVVLDELSIKRKEGNVGEAIRPKYYVNDVKLFPSSLNDGGDAVNRFNITNFSMYRQYS